MGKRSGVIQGGTEAIVASSHIESLIVEIRGQQVMLDRDLASLYGVETKVLNQAVKRNINRFPDRFRFQLTEYETNELVTNCDRLQNLKHSAALDLRRADNSVALKHETGTSDWSRYMTQCFGIKNIWPLKIGKPKNGSLCDFQLDLVGIHEHLFLSPKKVWYVR